MKRRRTFEISFERPMVQRGVAYLRAESEEEAKELAKKLDFYDVEWFKPVVSSARGHVIQRPQIVKIKKENY